MRLDDKQRAILDQGSSLILVNDSPAADITVTELVAACWDYARERGYQLVLKIHVNTALLYVTGADDDDD